MQYSSLGYTGLIVSRLALGTAGLGMDYGFRGTANYKKPNILPNALRPLKLAAARVAQECTTEVQSVSELALRYCLSFDAVSTVVIGVRSLEELETNVRDAEQGALSAECIHRLSMIEIDDHNLVTPGTWQGLI